ncbi:hypothetical protein Zmor_014555 [Zophobas morio]|uniref:Reverse transcriptase domain-containing protein n=1 Tax=Zophobas morio TaxID=2755281 RepID=A0AA38ICB3_9CUCU|nr:hypothetical protein Zmor_014555 [Zophobas morio]
MEAIIYEKTLDFLQKHKIIPSQQHGFVPGKSVSSNLLCCLSDWSLEVDRGNSVDVAYLDFSKAFDRVPKRRLLFKFQHYGITDLLLRWIESVLTDRIFKVKVGNCFSLSAPVLSAVPQGSILGPLLFITYVADLSGLLKSPRAFYADDLKIYGISSDHQKIKRDLTITERWCEDWLLPLNTSKCKLLYIGKNNPRHRYFINNVELSTCDEYLDLGVLITSSLSWSEHLTRIIAKANKIIYLVSKTFVKPSVETTAKIYKTYIRPILEFANNVWTPVLERDKKLLESTQRRVTRMPYGINRPQYLDRLATMNLTSLSIRRTRGDIITTFQALTTANSPIRHLFSLNPDTRTRGHIFKLQKENFKTRSRQHFLSNRVFDPWNSLPDYVVLSNSVLSFKINYDHYCTE